MSDVVVLEDTVQAANDQPVVVSPKEYFNALKSKKQTITDADLDVIYDNCLQLFQKYERAGQLDAMKKLMFHLDVIEKEHQALARGINTFVYLADVKHYVENVQDRVVKIIEIERYEREIPEDIIAAYESVKDLFTKFFIVFTDYTKEHVDKTKKERDPILFGMFQNKDVESTAERLYFIGDWEDEYCDLTLDRLISGMKEVKRDKSEPVAFEAQDTRTLDDFRAKVKALEEEKRKGKMMSGSSLYTIATNATNTSLPYNVIQPTIITAPAGEATPKVAPSEPETVFSKVRSFLRGKKNN